MIGKLKGILDLVKGDWVLIDVKGVFYRVYLNEFNLGSLVVQEDIELFIYTDVKEDHIKLYGFEKITDLELFELLLSISGIGPKAALGILNIASPEMIKSAVLNEDISILTKVSGIGKKTAQRVVLELKNKIDNLQVSHDSQYKENQEFLEAFIAMGYSQREARDAMKLIPKGDLDISEKIKIALMGMKK